MAYKEQKTTKIERISKRPKNSFGLYCKGLRKILGINITQAADLIGVSQPYLTQLENGTVPLTSVALYKCMKGYLGFKNLTIEAKLEIVYEMLQNVETIEIELSQVTIIHRENLFRLIAELLLNEEYPPETMGCISWNRVSGCINSLKEPPPKQEDWVSNVIIQTKKY